MGVDWGNVPSWISAVGSLAAFGTAIWAARAAWKQVAHLNEQKALEQASKVAAWLEMAGNLDADSVFVYYLNLSNLPVYDLVVTFFGIDLVSDSTLSVTTTPETGAIFLDVAPPSREPKHLDDAGINDWIRSAAIRMKSKKSNEGLSAEDYAENLARFLHTSGVVIQFRDANNKVWVRDIRGELRRANQTEFDRWDTIISEAIRERSAVGKSAPR